MRRPLIHCAFLDWLGEARPRLLIPLDVAYPARDRLDLTFIGTTPAIRADLVDYELNVYAERDGRNWDILLWLDACPQRTGRGYVCGLCNPDAATVFATREALWRDHLFEPFLAWVNEVMASADFLSFYGVLGSMTWAKLERRDAVYPEQPTARMPLRV